MLYFLDCLSPVLIILNGPTNYLNPLIYQYLDTVNINIETIFKCWCLYSNSSQWTINKVDSLTGHVIQPITFPATVNATNTSNLILPLNGTLAYGVYQLVYQLITISPVNQFFSNATVFICVFPGYFNVLGFPSLANLTVDPMSAISFAPSLYSTDPNSIINPVSLNYKFYCILTDATNAVQPNNFNQMLYSVQPNVQLTSDQIKAPDACFKSSSLIKFKFFILFNG